MIHSLFQTPVYEYQGSVQETFLVQNEIKTLLPAILETDTFENPVGWNDGVQTNIKARFNSIQDFKLVNLSNYIEMHVRKYISQIGAWEPMPTKLCHSWINLVNTGQRQEWHQHQDSVISGTYYFQTSGNDGDIVFKTPIPYVEMELFPLGRTVDKFFRVQPKVGKIVLFPGWLSHCVEVNNTQDSRISISFNYLRDNFAKT